MIYFFHSLRSYKSNTSQNNTGNVQSVAALLDLTIAKIASSDMQTAMEALAQLEDVFSKENDDEEIIKRIDQVGMHKNMIYQ